MARTSPRIHAPPRSWEEDQWWNATHLFYCYAKDIGSTHQMRLFSGAYGQPYPAPRSRPKAWEWEADSGLTANAQGIPLQSRL